MCGICGFSGLGDEYVTDRMLSAMLYRGPDGIGNWNNGQDVYFGHARLSIVDLVTGDQPLVSPDGMLAVVFNGEIYNHQELRRQLERYGHRFQTRHSDTEVLLYGYRQWGLELTEHLNGMWAFALYDKKNNLLWLSRDRFGKKPLFYGQVGDSFVFSSELHSLATYPGISKEIDEDSLVKYFAHGYVPSPNTLLKNSFKLPAGHNLVFDLKSRKAKVTRYWRYIPEPDNGYLQNPALAAERLVEEMYSAVKLRMVADVPVGVFLSGGVDSSSVTSMAVSCQRGDPVNSFSIGFEEESFDESGYARDVSSILGTNHFEEKLSVSRCLNLLDDIYSRLDEPMADSSLVPSFLMCRVASGKVKVALGGDGSDELFAGYDPFKAINSARLYSKFVPDIVHSSITKLVGQIPVSHRNMSADFKLKKFLSGLGYDQSMVNPVWLGPLPPGHLERLFGRRLKLEDIYSEAIDAWNSTISSSSTDRTIQFYIELYLQNDILVKMDRAGMLNSLEVRSPFLDKNLVDHIRTIPDRLKFDGKETKKILKAALAPVLPIQILQRQKKGFGMPVGKWFRDRHLEIDETIFSGYMDSKFAKKMQREHQLNVADWRGFLWAYHCLERWSKQSIFSSTK